MSERPPRLTFDELFDLLAIFYCCRGTCDRLRAAAIIRDEDNILVGAGYNGSLPGDPHCDDIGHEMVDNHCIRTNHGEKNAVLNCVDLARIKNGTATMVGSPCYDCARELISKRIKRLRYIGIYSNPRGGDKVEELCRRRGVILEYIDPEDILIVLQKALDFMQGPGGLFRNFSKIILKLAEEEKYVA